jgi:hypothetical protein
MTPPAEGSVLDRRTLNRALLARQCLLERVAMPAAEMIEHLVGMQAQVPTDPYVALWSRLRNFDPGELSTLMLERRAVRMTLMRTTLHLVTARDALALRPVLQETVARGLRGSPFWKHLEGIDLEALLAAAADLVEERPRTTSELRRLLAERAPSTDPTSLAYAARYLLPLVQVTPRGVWGRSAAPRVTTLSSWLGVAVDGDPAPDATVLRYLRAFGPASSSDIRTWSWLTGLREVIERLRPRLRTYRDERGRDLLDVPDGVFVDPATPAPVRFLPEYDNLVLSHDDRSRITGDGAWGAAYSHKGTFFVDGFLAGAWRLGRTRDATTLSVEPLAELRPADREAVTAEGQALLAFLAPDAARREVLLLAPAA